MKSPAMYNYKKVTFGEFGRKTKGSKQNHIAAPDGFLYWVKNDEIVGRNKRSGDVSIYEVATAK